MTTIDRAALLNALLDAQLASVTFTAGDGYPSTSIRTNEQAAEIATDTVIAHLSAGPKWEYRISLPNGTIQYTETRSRVARARHKGGTVLRRVAGVSIPAGPWEAFDEE